MSSAPDGKKLVRSPSGLRMVPENGAFSSPFALDEPQWVPDKECARCMQCDTKFDFLTRKVRHLPSPLCSLCTLGNWSYFENKTESLMSQYVSLFLHTQPLSFLSTGATFLVTVGTSEKSETMMCRLSNNHRYLFLDGESHFEVELSRISSMQVLTAGSPPGDKDIHTYTSLLESPYISEGASSRATGMVLHYKTVGSRDLQQLQLEATDDSKTASTWLAAMHKAAKLLYESRDQ
ncbi:zinc finger FYVE domain-containing protein 21 isoform X2 [Arapaima gigas]